MPAHLAHRLTYTAGEEAGEHAVAGATVAVERVDTVPVIGPPVRGGPWVVIHDASWPRGHRRVFYAVDGRARLPGRHATDWVRVDDDGRTARGDAKLARDALGYGEAVIAVADATVAAVRDGYAEHARVADNRKHPPADAAGNHVVLSLGDGRFAFYEHLRPGSVRVRAGQRVRRGDVLGELGFSGDSTGPHLHFHVADAASPLGSEGRPFALERFRSLGRYADLSRLGKARWDARDAEADAVRTAELPQGNSVIVVEGAR
jgi:murein DD-endopeptidase